MGVFVNFGSENIYNKPYFMLISVLGVLFMFINSVPKITITKIISANRILTSPLKVTVKRDNRNQWGLVLKTSGKTYYTINNKEILSDCFHPVILTKGETL